MGSGRRGTRSELPKVGERPVNVALRSLCRVEGVPRTESLAEAGSWDEPKEWRGRRIG